MALTLSLALAGCSPTVATTTTVTLDKTTGTVAVGSTLQITETGSAVTWSSSNTAVATVSSAGLVTGVTRGTATITAAATDGTSATCAVSVASVYIPGAVWNTSGPYPVCWKDGTIVTLGITAGYNAEMVDAESDTVYAAGWKHGTTTTPAYWNGSAWNDLAQPSDYSYCWYAGIAVLNGSVYVAGNIYLTTGVYIGGYWKDGTWTTCTATSYNGANLDGYIGGVVATGGHFYLAGFEKYVTTPESGPNEWPVYFVDGVKSTLPQGTDPDGNTNTGGWINTTTGVPTVVASGTDVYVAGTTYGTPWVPIVWKNGAIYSLGTSGKYQAQTIAVSGSDVYVGGQTDSNGATSSTACSAVYFKNGTLTTLPQSGSQAYVTGIAAGSDVWAIGKPLSSYGGTDPCTPLCWKNGASYALSYGTGYSYAKMSALAAVGNDVVFAATVSTGASGGDIDWSTALPVYWKNGTLVQLSLGESGGSTNTGGYAGDGPFVSMP